jgi:hypothetical protein
MIDFFNATGPRLALDSTSVLDIGACVIGGVDLAPKRAIPDDGDPRIDHSLEGFLFTCGPDHIRQSESVEGRADGRQFPLHGSFSSHPARILSSTSGEAPECHASVTVALADGGTALLDRRWRMDESGAVFLSDRVTNTGPTAFPPMLMYHMNIGAIVFDDKVRLSGDMLDGGGFPWTFGPGNGGVFCMPARVADKDWAEMVLGPIASIGGRSLRVRFRTDTLPFLQIWRNQTAPANVIGIEPASHRWEKRNQLAERGELIALQPGESIDYALSFAFIAAE